MHPDTGMVTGIFQKWLIHTANIGANKMRRKINKLETSTGPVDIWRSVNLIQVANESISRNMASFQSRIKLKSIK